MAAGPLAAAKALSLGSLWASSGLGPLLLSVWAKLSPYPPFSWLNWMLLQVAKAPTYYKLYLAFWALNLAAKSFCPGLQAQLVTGSWLGLLKSFYPQGYTANVADRLRALLSKQVELRAPSQKLFPDPRRQEVFDAAVEKLKEDPVLVDALGSTSALQIWHKLEKTKLEDPSLTVGLNPSSQTVWVIQALRMKFLKDIEAAARESVLGTAVQEASKRLEQLKEAVAVAEFSAQSGVFGTAPRSAFSQVAQASAEAAKALEALEKAKALPKNLFDAQQEQTAWRSNVQELEEKHASHPAVVAMLQRLSQVPPPTA